MESVAQREAQGMGKEDEAGKEEEKVEVSFVLVLKGA
jgi:hypothetical protein